MWHHGSRGDAGRIVGGVREGREWLREYDPAAAAFVESVFAGEFVHAGGDDDDISEILVSLADGGRSCCDATSPCTVLVVNETSLSAALFWVDHGGVEHSYASLPPGGAVGQSTFVGHCWRVRSGALLLGSFMAVPGFGRAVIEEGHGTGTRRGEGGDSATQSRDERRKDD